jgi:molybdopterin converting factor small subunit
VKVTVRLFATFRDFCPKQATQCSFDIKIDEHETVQGVVGSLRLPEELPRIILVNGLFTSEDSPLREGDIISIFPPLIGGVQ